jgi:hypothetical protein
MDRFVVAYWLELVGAAATDVDDAAAGVCGRDVQQTGYDVRCYAG